MADVFGIVRVKLNGTDHGTMQGSTLEVGGVTRTSQFASGRRIGSSEEPAASKADLKIAVTPTFDLNAIKNFRGTIEYITDVPGLTFIAANCQVMTGGQFTDNGGGYSVSIEGDEAEPLA